MLKNTKLSATKAVPKAIKLKEELAQVKKKKSDLEKSESALLKKIEAEEKKNKPKSIMDRVKSMKDVLTISKPTKEELAILNYSGKSKRLILSKRAMVLSLIAEVLNEGHEFKMTPDEYRYYPYFYINTSGFVFHFSTYGDTFAHTTSASHLCFKTRELSDYAGKTFLKEFMDFIILKEA
jgi:hypothetical protein